MKPSDPEPIQAHAALKEPEDELAEVRALIGADANWQGSIRGRVGYAFNRALLYGTGGFALADIDTDVPGGGDDGSGTEWGWTLGAGLDYAVTDKIFLRGEYRYTDLADFDNDNDQGEIEDLDSNTFRLGVGVLF